MQSERWHKIDRMLAAALQRPPEQRTRFVERVARDDPELAEELRALLEADALAGPFLETPAVVDPELFDGDAPVPSDQRPGTEVGLEVGGYRLEREIGCGGMGRVYAARRAAGDPTEVAIKLLDRGPRSADTVRRFRDEARILARLDHPNIARLYESGHAPDGRPFLAMELIDGRPLDEYCDEHRLPIKARIELVIVVCTAVQLAHRNLIVHRDIKPSNILVGVDGVPRLVDFGIAKLLGPDGPALNPDGTGSGLVPMTPSYASPEQFRGDAITTASDVYSLGVVLYQLLAGRLPHDFQDRAPLEIARILSEEAPIKPSGAIGAQTATPNDLGRLRSTSAQRLRNRLTGDLDNICLRALHKDPARRYASVEQLSEDLRRHLAGLPVVARRDTLGYRLSSFARRNRLVVGAASVLLTSLIAFLVAMSAQVRETTRQRDRAEHERDNTREVSSFLVELFSEMDPWTARNDEVGALELLERASEKASRQFDEQPQVLASLQDVIGTVYLNLGLHDEATPLLEAALSTRERELGADHHEFGQSLTRVASLHQATGDYETALATFERALPILEASLGPDHPWVGVCLVHMTSTYRALGRWHDALPLGQRALTIFEGLDGTTETDVAVALRALAGAYATTEPDTAEELLRRALEIDHDTYGDEHLATAADRINLAILLGRRGETNEAIAAFEQIHRILERAAPDDHPMVGQACIAMADVLLKEKRYEEADQNLKRALALFEGNNLALVRTCSHKLGQSLLEQRRFDEAESFLARALGISEQLEPPGHPSIGRSFHALAQLRMAQDRLDEAEDFYQRAFAIWDRYHYVRILQAVPENYAALLRELGRTAEAENVEARARAAAPRETEASDS